MSQHDFEILTSDTNTRVGYRNSVNSAFQALASNSSGDSEPSTKYSCQFWADTSSNLLKMRNTANSAWITIGALDADSFGLVKLSQTNEFTASQSVSGNALLLRFRDTGGGGEDWAIRSKDGNLEVCENTGTESVPTWTPRMTLTSSEITSNAQNAVSALNTQNVGGNTLSTQQTESGVILSDENGKIDSNWLGQLDNYDASLWSGRQYLVTGSVLWARGDGTSGSYSLPSTSGYVTYFNEWISGYEPNNGKFAIVYNCGTDEIDFWNDTGAEIRAKMYWAKLG